MRFVAMRLHTKDQAPKEGGKEASKTPMMAVRTMYEKLYVNTFNSSTVAANSGGLFALSHRV